MTPQDLFARMGEAFVPANAQGVKATIQVSLSGDEGGDWTVKIADGTCDVSQSIAANPDMKLSMSADDYVAMSTGNLNPMNAFMQGKIKLQGDMGLAMKFQNMFKLGG